MSGSGDVRGDGCRRVWSLGGRAPAYCDSNWIAPTAQLIGDVALEEEVSIWFGAVLRAEFAPIRVGFGSNVQDNTVIHVDVDVPAVLGRDVTVGHGCIIHGCHIRDCTLVGMGSVILNEAEIGPYCLIAAGTLIPQGKKIAEGSLVMGSPGKVVRQLTPDERKNLERSAQDYRANAAAYKRQLGSLG